jgi:AcrR family transcriptional regulator
MARQQERARRTRAAILGSAAIEFGKSGYAAASLNRILEGSNATKGAMYFHFDSKEDLARAVIEAAQERYQASVDRWLARTDLGPLEALHGLVDEIALRFQTDVIIQAEFRLVIEPDFYRDVQSGGGKVWGDAAYHLAVRAKQAGELREDVDLERFTRVLAAVLTGQRYMADQFSDQSDIRKRFEEGLDVLVESAASDAWREKFSASGWSAFASPDDLATSS